MLALILLATISLIEAKPSRPFPAFSFSGVEGHMVIGGTDASPGEFPWQLSQTRGGGHSCGASLLSAGEALSAAHCVDGALVGSITIIAGLHQRSNPAGSQEVSITSYTMHADYNTGLPTFSNDISIIYLASNIAVGGNVALLTLPSGGTTFDGVFCVISGWGRTSTSNILPDTLQKATIEVISTTECETFLQGVGRAWDNHICLYDRANNIGSCNGDSGGPLNCPEGGTVVAGITSWGVSSGAGNCLQTYPSVYTRTSSYLAWISANRK